MIELKVGMPVVYNEFGQRFTKGKILSVNGNNFTCYEPMNCFAQYNDSPRDFNVNDIGTKVFIVSDDP